MNLKLELLHYKIGYYLILLPFFFVLLWYNNNNNILGYELPWNSLKFNPNYFEKVSEDQLSAKQPALKEYKSQSHRKYMDPNFHRSLAIVRGIQSNTLTQKLLKYII